MKQPNSQNGKRKRLSEVAPTDLPVLITGGAGFIGTNLAHRLLQEGRRVVLYDNLSRDGVEENARWLQRKHGSSRVRLIQADIRDAGAVRTAVQGAAQVFHFAAQVAVTSSLVDARNDLEVNLGGTFNVLDALNSLATPPPLIFTSTNKVYGDLSDISLVKTASRYKPANAETREEGISESRPLEFHTPYGCSKGAADQYVLDYARSFRGSAAVFRMSCIYGPHQMGTEDQGWVAHFIIQAIDQKPLTIYGDGFQVRDILFVEDLVDALLLAQERMADISGQAFNIGGGPDRAVSLVELLSMIERARGCRIKLGYESARTGDQRYYVSNTRKFEEATGWTPAVGAEDGIARLCDWLEAERSVNEAELAALTA